MNEPANHTALVDRGDDTWIRVDECPGRYGTWWPLTDGPGWEPQERGGIGTAVTWNELAEHGRLTPASPERTARALARVRKEWNQ